MLVILLAIVNRYAIRYVAQPCTAAPQQHDELIAWLNPCASSLRGNYSIESCMHTHVHTVCVWANPASRNIWTKTSRGRYIDWTKGVNG